jgi:hypothetical protein
LTSKWNVLLLKIVKMIKFGNLGIYLCPGHIYIPKMAPVPYLALRLKKKIPKSILEAWVKFGVHIYIYYGVISNYLFLPVFPMSQMRTL